MRQYNISKDLLEIKLKDYEINSGLMPKKARILTRLFAKSLGKSAGKVISCYNGMYSQIEKGHSLEEVQNFIKKDVNAKSKVTFKLPFMQPRQARICGLVAMNYSGFFNRETELYSSLINDLKTKQTQTSIEAIVENSKQIAKENSQKYEKILQSKQKAIYDFGILMGLINDNRKLDELKSNMHKDIAKYFNMVVKMHKGNKLGISWPLPLKKFSAPLKESLYRDTISYAIQQGIEKDYGFKLPEKVAYEQVIDQIKETTKLISSKDNSFRQKWKTATALPATMFFLSGMNAYAQESLDKKEAVRDTLEAGLTAATFAGTTADDMSDFATTWFTLFTTIV